MRQKCFCGAARMMGQQGQWRELKQLPTSLTRFTIKAFEQIALVLFQSYASGVEPIVAARMSCQHVNSQNDSQEQTPNALFTPKHKPIVIELPADAIQAQIDLFLRLVLPTALSLCIRRSVGPVLGAISLVTVPITRTQGSTKRRAGSRSSGPPARRAVEGKRACTTGTRRAR